MVLIYLTLYAFKYISTIHLHRPARSCAMGNLPDEVTRCLPQTAYPTAPSRPGVARRGGVRAHHARLRGRGMAVAVTMSPAPVTLQMSDPR